MQQGLLDAGHAGLHLVAHGLDLAALERLRGRVRNQLDADGRWIVAGTAKLKAVGERGFAATPTRPGHAWPIIAVSTHLRKGSPMRQEAAIHEALHLCFPGSTEKQVQTSAEFVAKIVRILA